MLEGIRNNSQSIFIKVAFGIIILVFVFMGIGSIGTTASIVAKVNGEDITEQEFLSAYNQQRENIMANLPNVTEEFLEQMNFNGIVLESLVLKTLLEQESERTGISITPLELYEVISLFPFTHGSDGKFNQEVYQKALASMGQTPKRFEDTVKRDLLEAKFKELFANFSYASPLQARQVFDHQLEQRAFEAYIIKDEDFLASTNPSEEETKALYEEIKAQYTVPASVNLEFVELNPTILAKPELLTDEQILAEYNANKDLYDTPEKVTASHILLLLDENASAEDEAKVMEKITEIQAKLANGENFGDLAKQYSEDPGSAPLAGELGTFTRNQMVKPFEDAAFSQEIGTVSEPVRTRFGYHLILVNAKEAAQALAQDAMREVIGVELAAKEAAGKVQTVVDSLLIKVQGGTSLEDAAKQEGLEVDSTSLIPFDRLAQTYNFTQTDIDKIRAATIGTVMTDPISTGTSLYIVKVTENAPERTKAYDEVVELVLAEAQNKAAHALALEKANEVLKTINTNLPTDLGAIENSTMSRNGASSLIVSLPLSQALFDAPVDAQWLPEAYALEDGYLIAKAKELIPATEELWLAEKDALLAQMNTSRQDMFYSVFLQELRNKADIQIVNTLYFQ